MESVKHRNHEKAVALLESYCERIGREVHVYESGAADFHLWVEKYKFLGAEPVGIGWLKLVVDLGAITPSSAMVDELSKAAGHHIVKSFDDEPTKILKLGIKFNRDVSGEVVDHYGAVFRTINTFATSKWETEVDPNLKGHDWMGVAVRHPAKKLSLTVWLPVTFLDPEVHVVCERDADFPKLQLDDVAGEVLIGASGYTVDHGMGHYEGRNLRPLGLKNGTDRYPDARLMGWALDISEPMVGYAYLIRWRVNTEADRVSIKDRGATLELRRALLQFKSENPPPKILELRDLAKGILDDIYKALLRPKIKSQYAHDEKIAVAVFAYDQRVNRLELILEAGDNAELSARVASIPLGEGVAGTAFKKRIPQMFVLRELWGPEHDGGYVYYGDKRPPEDEKFAALIAIPLPLRDIGFGEDISPEETIGVLTIASTAKESGLLSLIPDPMKSPDNVPDAEARTDGEASAAREAKNTLLFFLWQTAVKYMVGITAEVAKRAAHS